MKRINDERFSLLLARLVIKTKAEELCQILLIPLYFVPKQPNKQENNNNNTLDGRMNAPVSARVSNQATYSFQRSTNTRQKDKDKTNGSAQRSTAVRCDNR